MTRGAAGGRTFYLILMALLSAILIMAGAHAVSVSIQHQHHAAAHRTAMEAAMINGSVQIDAFWDNVASFLYTLSSRSSIHRLYNYPNLPLQEASLIQQQTADGLAAFLGDAPYAVEGYVSLHNRDYLITGSGVTKKETYFSHRYVGALADFQRLLGEKHAFHLTQMPFPLTEAPPTGIRPAPLALMQTLYDKGHPIGTCVITLDAAGLERVFSQYLTVPATCTLLMNGAPLPGDTLPLAQLPPEDQQGYLPGVGVVFRRPSLHFPQLSYLLVSPESALFPRYQGVLSGLIWGLMATTLVMGMAAFLAARQLYRPMRTLMKSLDSPIDPRTDECKLILQSFHHLTRRWDDTQQEMHASSPLVRDALVQHLLLDSSWPDRVLMEKYLPGTPMDGQFYVFALLLAFRERESPREGGPSRRRTALFSLEEAFGSRLLTIIPTGESTYALVTLPLTEGHHQQLCQDIARTLRHLEDACPGGMVLCAGGSGAAQMDWIGRSHQEALALLSLRPANAAYAYLSGPAPEDPAPLLPRESAGTLLSLLQSDRLEEAAAYVRELLERLYRAGCAAQSFTRAVSFLHGQVMLEAGSRTPAVHRLMVEMDLSPLADPQQQMAALQDNIHLLRQRPTEAGMDHDLAEIVQYIRASFSTPINLNAAADHFGYSPSYFSRYFKQRMGVNFTAYLQRVRMEHACMLLSDTKDAVSHIARQCGYQHPTTFIAAFEKAMGMTPGAFRKVKGGEG